MFPTNDDLVDMLIELLAKTDTNRKILINLLASSDDAKIETLTATYAEMDAARSLEMRKAIEAEDRAVDNEED